MPAPDLVVAVGQQFGAAGTQTHRTVVWLLDPSAEI
jgi:hypothetical protein